MGQGALRKGDGPELVLLEPTERPVNERLQVGPPTPTPGIRVEEGRKKSSWNWMFCVKEWYKGEVPQVHDPLSH